MPTSTDFQTELSNIIQAAEKSGAPYVDVKAGDLHRRVGDYPDPRKHRMPICCNVMRQNMKPNDTIRYAPPKGDGPRLEIRYRFPR